MTDSILRSYHAYTHTSLVPFPVVVVEPEEGALGLLFGETDGSAFDATTYDAITTEAYVGGPVGGTVAVIDTGTPANDLSNVALDSGNLVQSGTSAKMVHFPTSPYVRWSPHNQIARSQEFDSGWNVSGNTVTANNTTAPDGTSTADKLTANGGVAHQRAMKSVTVVVHNDITLSMYVKKSTALYFSLGIFDNNTSTNFFNATFDITGASVTQTDDNGNGVYVSSSITSVGSGWYRLVVSGRLPGALDPYLYSQMVDTGTPSYGTDYAGYTWNAAGTEAVWVWGGQACRGYNANPYLATTSAARIGVPQSYDTAAAQYGILVEPASINLIQYSEQLDNGSVWGSSGCTRTGSAADGPEGGTTTADRLSATAGSSGKYAFQGFTAAAAVQTISAYIKSDGGQWIGMCVDGGVQGNGVFFDVINGVVGNQGSGSTGTITAIGNGWYRCTATKSNGTGAKTLLFEPHSADNEGQTWNSASGAEKFLIWGVQVEDSSIVTSYIPTMGATSTRAADVPGALDTTFPGSDTNDTIYLDYKPLAVGSGTRYGWAYWKDANNFYSLAGVTANPTMGNTNAGSPEFAVDLGTLVAGTRTQITIAAKGSDFDGSQDGAAPTAQGTATLTTGYTTLYFGTFGTTGSELNGYIYRMVQVPYQRETVNGDLETWRYNF